MLRRLTAIAIIFLCAGALIYWAMPAGPRERDRVTHPAGYSIDAPQGWSAKMVVTTSGDYRDQISLSPDDWKGLPPLMWVRRFANPPDIAALQARGFIRGDLNGVGAWVHQEKPKKYTMRLAVVETNGQWYEVGVSVPGKESALLDDWWQFALSFRPAPTPKFPATTQSVAQ